MCEDAREKCNSNVVQDQCETSLSSFVKEYFQNETNKGFKMKIESRECLEVNLFFLHCQQLLCSIVRSESCINRRYNFRTYIFQLTVLTFSFVLEFCGDEKQCLIQAILTSKRWAKSSAVRVCTMFGRCNKWEIDGTVSDGSGVNDARRSRYKTFIILSSVFLVLTVTFGVLFALKKR